MSSNADSGKIEKTVDQLIDEKLDEISNNERLSGKVFHAGQAYFVIYEGQIAEISDDAGCSPRGGWFPDIVNGITEEETEAVEKMIDAFDIDDYFFDEMLEDCSDDLDDEELDEWVEEYSDDEDFAEKYKAIKKMIMSKRTLFSSMADFISKFKKNGLDPDALYYEWEGEWIDFYDNVATYGEERGTYDFLSDERWLEVLNNIENYIVTADK